MAAHTITRNKKPAEATTPGGLNLVFSTTLSSPPEKDEDQPLYTLKAAASSAEPHDPYPFFWKPDFTAPGFAFAGLGGA